MKLAIAQACVCSCARCRTRIAIRGGLCGTCVREVLFATKPLSTRARVWLSANDNNGRAAK